jgi:Fe-S-cluster containining protein
MSRRSTPNFVAKSRHRDDESELRQLESELAALYREVDARYAGHSCPASTECCRFGITGREPYVTSLELAVLARAMRAKSITLGEPPAKTPRRLELADERRCPLLSDGGRCRVYEARPLGCRTFWCERASVSSPVKHAELLGFVRRVQALAERHASGGDKGRPLTRALAAR